MERRSWIKNSLMALAVSLLPKVLRPMEPAVTRDEYVEIEWSDDSRKEAIKRVMELVDKHKPSDNYNFFWYEKHYRTHSDVLYLR